MIPIFSLIDNFKKFYEECIKEEKDSRYTLTYQLFKLFNLSLDNPSANLNPASFTKMMIKKNSIWGHQQQQDSSEYLLDLIDGLRSEQGKKVIFVGGRLNKKTIEPDKKTLLFKILSKQKEEEYCSEKYKYLTNMYSSFNNMFNFLVKSTKVCPRCKFTNHSIESTNILKLALPSNNAQETLENLIINYTKPESLDDDNKSTCTSCIHKVKSGSMYTIINLPQILIINLKRFEMNSYGLMGQKKQNRIIYPLELNLTDIVNDDKEYNYQLIAVNMHMGFSINHGHYISMVKLATTNTWHIFNDDSMVREVTDFNQLINNNAYILFYLRKN